MASQHQASPGAVIPIPDIEKHFSTFADKYENQSGGVTRNVAQTCLTFLPPITSSSVIHDNACGPGVVTAIILKQFAEKGRPKIEATDFAKGMIDYLQNEIRENGWDTVHAQVRDSSDLGCFEDATFTHSITNFGLFILPDAVKGAKEIYRTLKPGGAALVTVWKEMDTTAIVHGAQKAIRPDHPLWNPVSPDWMHEWKVKSVMEEAGFESVEVRTVENWWVTGDEEGFRELFRGPFWGIVYKDWTDGEKGKWVDECWKQATEKQKREGRLRANAWACIAVK